MKMLIGSTALAIWTGKEFNGDIDIITDEPIDLPGRVEIHSPGMLNNSDAFMFATDTMWNGIPVCSLSGLTLLKRSHMHLLWKWDRNMFLFSQMPWPVTRDTMSLEEHQFLKLRKKLTRPEVKSPSLMKSNDDFFDDNVNKHFVHDDIHEFVAYGDRPLYTRMKKDFALAKCEKDMWNEFTFEDKCRCVLEESYVIGLERWMVPMALNDQPVMPARFAVRKALKKVCTTLCSGWFRDFAIDYYSDIVSRIDCTKMELFMEEKFNARTVEAS